MFTFHVDPGHGWVEVSAADLRALRMVPADFSAYSYRKAGDLFYLEEDCDAPKFVERYKAVYGREPAFREQYHSGSAPMRRMRSIHD